MNTKTNNIDISLLELELLVEKFTNDYLVTALANNIADSCVSEITTEERLNYYAQNLEEFFDDFCNHYDVRSAVARYLDLDELLEDMDEDDIIRWVQDNCDAGDLVRVAWFRY